MRIGEVAERSGVSARMLRHYDALGLVRPSQRSSTGYREYAPEDIRRIFHVESLRSLGLSLKEIGRALDEASVPHVVQRAGTLFSVFFGAEVAGGAVPLATLHDRYPVALLTRV